jgi:hypothetical protein
MMWSEVAVLVLQVLCLGESLYNSQWWKALYWFGAFILTLAIVKGMQR